MTNRFQNIQICFGVTGNVLFSGEEIDHRLQSLLNQLPCNHTAVATVVASATENSDLKFFKIFESCFQSLNYTHPRIFHEENTGNTKLFGRKSVDFANLICSEN